MYVATTLGDKETIILNFRLILSIRFRITKNVKEIKEMFQRDYTQNGELVQIFHHTPLCYSRDIKRGELALEGRRTSCKKGGGLAGDRMQD